MRNGFLGSLAALLLGVGLAQAQWGPGPYSYPPPYMPPYPGGYGYGMPVYGGIPFQQAGAGTEVETTAPPSPGEGTANVAPGQSSAAPAQTPPPPSLAASHTALDDAERSPCHHCWVIGEYLYWWTKAAPSTVPLVSTSSVVAPLSGAINQPGTQILLGGSDINLPVQSGFRLTIGGWIDNDNKFGIEASGFILENGVTNFNLSSGTNGSPIIGVPATIVGPTFIPNGQYVIPIANPGIAFNPLIIGSTNGLVLPSIGPDIGSINVSVASQLFGAELNGYYNLYRGCGLSLDVLGGVRYLNLTESLTITTNSFDQTFFTQTSYNDSFQTTNQFYGGQIGLRAEYDYGRWSILGTVKAAFGVNNEAVTINGSSSQSLIGVPGSTQNYVGGIFAQPSNIGTYHQTSFSFVPSANLKIGYNLTPALRVFAGYDILYWTNVARATNQLDGTINPSQAMGGTLVGPVNPAPMINQSNYFAQGLSVGIMFRY